MTKELQFKRQQEDGSWQHVDITEVAGKSIRECFQMWDGDPVVVKVTGGMICGQQEWMEFYRKRGHQVASFPEAIKMLEEKEGGPEALDYVFVVEEMGEHFAGATVQGVKI
jgi:hypothetical protein